ncbi:UBP-type zinc finger domain-containing protein [Myceligenerans indicum]|uniref:UBP-type zinc finger domain-containing protein n=1 Tax=Myceligenerans indicum TaxID=2593663 RepID=A0ABS1LPQ4_9MICO|nr:UBP-type zinc finger domain-containing protein [Myceligenerans indicum]MBL0888222.1 UBP-type zinc finger domain-containing protein [Myceligenerans indicum]
MAVDLDPLIDPQIPPSGTGCRDCLETSTGWWFHLRRCATCGVVGCCDSSPAGHATRHARASGHAIVRSFEPGEDWFYDYRTDRLVDGTDPAPPLSRPVDQPAPGPLDRLPENWRQLLR